MSLKTKYSTLWVPFLNISFLKFNHEWLQIMVIVIYEPKLRLIQNSHLNITHTYRERESAENVKLKIMYIISVDSIAFLCM